jgi:hypothetical protein
MKISYRQLPVANLHRVAKNHTTPESRGQAFKTDKQAKII